jgi:hypothetical protein
MPGELLVVDPALLVWDRADYVAREHEYWVLAEDFLALTELLEETDYEPVLSGALAELIIDGFPADQLSGSGELRDFVRSVYLFLARSMDVNRDYGQAAWNGSVPDVCGRTHFPNSITQELARELAFVFHVQTSSHFASHSVVWSFRDGELKQLPRGGKIVPVWLGRTGYDQLLARTRRKYETHDKHDSTYGYGSRLPAELDEQEIQRALDIATELGHPDCLCARVLAADVVLVFRRHHQNKFHAYPIQTSEYSKYGIKPDAIPEL